MTARRCGSCTLCCKLLPVRELSKPANTRCRHQSHKGCAIYHQPRAGFPLACAIWSCAWLGGEPDLERPDRAGWVVDIMPDMIRLAPHDGTPVIEMSVVQVWVAPGVDPLGDPRLRRLAERAAAQGSALILRYGTERAVTIFAPAIASDGQWHIIDGKDAIRVESPSGNLLLDRLAAARLG